MFAELFVSRIARNKPNGKAILSVLVLIVVAIGTDAFISRNMIPLIVGFMQMRPDQAFDEMKPPPASDYDSEIW